MVDLQKNIQWWWSGSSKTIEKPSLAMVPWRKNIIIASFEKNDHRRSLNQNNRDSDLNNVIEWRWKTNNMYWKLILYIKMYIKDSNTMPCFCFEGSKSFRYWLLCGFNLIHICVCTFSFLNLRTLNYWLEREGKPRRQCINPQTLVEQLRPTHLTHLHTHPNQALPCQTR